MQPHLDTLNLSRNGIHTIAGLSLLHELHTLLLGNNRLSTTEDVAHLEQCPSLSCVDLQENNLSDGDGVLSMLETLPALTVLYLQGNPLVRSLPHYRHTVVGRLRHLTYLDDRPVFPEERRRCDAWWAAFQSGGGLAAASKAENAVVERLRAEAAVEDERQFRGFENFIRGVSDPKLAISALKEGSSAGAGGCSGPSSESGVQL